jgi:hypothetical protein
MFLVMKVAQLNKAKPIKCFRQSGQRYFYLDEMRMVRLRESVSAQRSRAGSGDRTTKQEFSAAERWQGLVMERL